MKTPTTELKGETWFRNAYIQGEGISLEPFSPEDARFELLGYPSDNNLDEFGDAANESLYAECWVRVKDNKMDVFGVQEAYDLLVSQCNQ